jgi:endogenous inhibitor of DNA gyrase (YacG/DUF329 family)
MPHWAVNCPNCKQEFTHTEIDKAMQDQAGHDPFGLLPKPVDEKRRCPHCNKESVFSQNQLFYRADAPGKGL